MNYIITSIVSGILFGLMDGLINANPLAVKLHAVYQPIMRASVNVPAGLLIDLLYGFLMAAIFLLLYKSLPGKTGLQKGLSYAVIIWFFRVLMYSASQWMMFNLSIEAMVYSLVAGFVEMLILGLFFGLTLKPQSS